MFATSLPVALKNGAGVPGLAVSMILVGLGVGGVKSTISPFIGKPSGSCSHLETESLTLLTGDQYPQRKPQLVRQKNGELAVVDSSRTLQFLYNAFYWSGPTVS
jgi:POT family proton-dependent oligopeptide transporter